MREKVSLLMLWSIHNQLKRNLIYFSIQLNWAVCVKYVFDFFILQSAIFNFQSLLTVILLLICTCAYIRALAPSLLDKNKTGYDPTDFKNIIIWRVSDSLLGKEKKKNIQFLFFSWMAIILSCTINTLSERVAIGLGPSCLSLYFVYHQDQLLLIQPSA